MLSSSLTPHQFPIFIFSTTTTQINPLPQPKWVLLSPLLPHSSSPPFLYTRMQLRETKRAISAPHPHHHLHSTRMVIHAARSSQMGSTHMSFLVRFLMWSTAPDSGGSRGPARMLWFPNEDAVMVRAMSKDGQMEGGNGNGANQRSSENGISSDITSHKRIRALGRFRGFQGLRNAISLNTGETDSPAESFRPQDADYSYMPSLSDVLAVLILAHVPRSDYLNLRLLNRRYKSLMESGELYVVRRNHGIKEASVLMFAKGEKHWWLYDPRSGARRNLPALPSDLCFFHFDKETICVGTHLIVSGKEIGGAVIWRYELAKDMWFKGPPMISSRCMFASADCGTVACVAGGIGAGGPAEVLNSVEKYDPESRTWDPLPSMNHRRKFCSGCFMDGKFYVIGGQDEKGKNLTCGEFYDPHKNEWELIPDMLKDFPTWSSRSPPLLAVINNELYLLEALSNRVKLYIKKTNSWKDLGESPLRVDHSRGWGVAFRSLGDELIVLGSRPDNYTGRGLVIYKCIPDPTSDVLQWQISERDTRSWSSFILNCAIMMA